MKTKPAIASRKTSAKATAKGTKAPAATLRNPRPASAASKDKLRKAAKPVRAVKPAAKPAAKAQKPAKPSKPAAKQPAAKKTPAKPAPKAPAARKVVAKKAPAKKAVAKKLPKPAKPVKPVAKKAVKPTKPVKSVPKPPQKAAPAPKRSAAAKPTAKTPAPKPKASEPKAKPAAAPKPAPKAKETPTPKATAPAPAAAAKPAPAPKAEPAPYTPPPVTRPAPRPVVVPKKIEAEPTAKTPRQLHFRMPAEWEPHYATWMTWPNKKGISFPGKGAYEAVIPTFLSMIRALITSEEVFLNVATEEDKQVVRESLTIAEQRRVHFVDTPSMEPWCRDHGATLLVRDEDRHGGSVAWKFNAWGAKYDKAMVDAQIAGRMAQFLGGKFFQPQIVLEGGSIDVNGTGTVLTTESCLLNKNRNKGMTKEAVEKILRDYLNVSNVLWLPGGVEGDDTDGHIDTITRFVNKNTVVTVVDDNVKDKNHAVLQKNLELLKGMKIEDGTELQVVPLPMPQPIQRKGQRLPATYANFYIGNKIVLLPTYDDPADEKALEVMVKSFPTRKIYPIDARELIWGLGAFHCLTQQVPLAGFPRVVDLVRNPPPAPRPVY